MINNGSATLTKVSQLGDANCFERGDALRGAYYVGVLYPFLHDKVSSYSGLHVDSMLSSTLFLKPLLAIQQ